MSKYTEAELDAMPLDQLRRLIHEKEMELARIDERQKVRLETAIAKPEWVEIARLNAWATEQPQRYGLPKTKEWPAGYKPEAYTRGFVAKQFALAGQSARSDDEASATAKEYLKRLG